MGLSKFPFVGLFSTDHESRGRPLLTRLVENSLPGVLVAVLSVYINDVRQDDRLAILEKRADSLGMWTADASSISSGQHTRLALLEAAMNRMQTEYISTRKK